MSVPIDPEWWPQNSVRREYEATKNPLYAWEAFKYRSVKEPIPEWVLEYLDRVAENLMKYARYGPRKGEVDLATTVAMEMKTPGQRGRDTMFNTYAITKRASKRANEHNRIVEAMVEHKKSIEAVAEELHKEFGISLSGMKSKVRRTWQEFIKSSTK